MHAYLYLTLNFKIAMNILYEQICMIEPRHIQPNFITHNASIRVLKVLWADLTVEVL